MKILPTGTTHAFFAQVVWLFEFGFYSIHPSKQMPSAERVAGQMRRAMNVHRFALGEKRQQENDLGALQRHKAAFKAEEISDAARKELYGESPHVPRFSATNPPLVPTKLNWARTRRFTAAPVDAKVSSSTSSAGSKITAAEAARDIKTRHGAIAATLRVKH